MSTRRPVIAMVSDSILPYHRGGKELRYHEVDAATGPRRRRPRLHDALVGGPATRTADGVTFHGICRRRPLYDGERRSTRQALAFALSCLRLVTTSQSPVFLINSRYPLVCATLPLAYNKGHASSEVTRAICRVPST